VVLSKQVALAVRAGAMLELRNPRRQPACTPGRPSRSIETRVGILNQRITSHL